MFLEKLRFNRLAEYWNGSPPDKGELEGVSLVAESLAALSEQLNPSLPHLVRGGVNTP